MKKLLLTMLIVTTGFTLCAQEVLFPPVIISGGGSGSEDGANVISRWRLSQINVLTIPDEAFDTSEDQEDLISLYPNPVEDLLYVDFKLTEERNYILRISDLLGRDLLIYKQGTTLPELKLELDVSGFRPAVYLLQLEFPLLNEREVYPFQKI